MKFNGYNYFGMKPGGKVFYPVSYLKIIIPCTVVEVEDVFNYPEFKASIWRYSSLANDGSVGVKISVPTKEVDDLGWPIWRKGAESDLAGLKQCSQFLCIDEPVGHSLLLGDDVFLSLEEARQQISPSNKKNLKIRLKKSRMNREKFIASTWKLDDEKHFGFEKMSLKKVYVRNY